MSARGDLAPFLATLDDLDNTLIRANWFRHSITVDVAKQRLISQANEIDRLQANLDEANSLWADAIAQRDTARHQLQQSVVTATLACGS